YSFLFLCLSDLPARFFIMDSDPIITMEEILPETEDNSFTDLETEYPAIVFNDASDVAFSREPTVSPLDNNKIDFNISFDESDDEDYMAVFDKNSFSCKIIYVNNLKTDSENENDKVNMPSSPLPEPTIGYIDDLDFFKDFENEFPVITYNDLKSKSNPLNSSQHINKFETSLSEYDKKEQNVLCVNDSFSLNVIFSNNPKTIKDNDDNIDITQLSGSKILNIDTKTSNELPSTNHDKTNKVFNEKIFIITLDADIVSWNCFNNWMPLNLIKNLYVPFGIQFDPKRYYKDGAHTRILRSVDLAIRKIDDMTLITRTVKRIFDLCTDLRLFTVMAPLPHRDLRHPWLRYQVEVYDEGIVHSYGHKLETIFRRQVNRVHVLDFAGLTDGMRQTLGDRLSMVYTWDDGEALFTSHAWRRLFEVKGPLVREFILDFLSTCRMSDIEMGLDVADTLCFQIEAGFGAYWSSSERVIADKGDLRDHWIEISSDMQFLGLAPSYVHIRDHVRRLCHKMIACSISCREQGAEKVTRFDLFYLRTIDHGTANVPYLLAQYLFRHAEGRKSGARLSEGYFIGRLAAHFGLVSDEGLRGLSIIAQELPVIDLHELARLNICARFGDTWAWAAPRPDRQQAATAGAPGAAKDAPAPEEGVQTIPAPVLEEVREMRQSVVGLQGVVESSITEQTRVSTLMISCMTQLMDASGRTYQAFDSTLVGSSQLSY
ncbi:hypothetical protein Tco_0685853, partial [Tanacetum coccineum]